MSGEAEVELFLKEFKDKLNFWGVIFRDDRSKNNQTLLDLEIRPIDREKVLKALEGEDYSERPLEEKLYAGADMWVFGKTVKKNEIYIKITMGYVNSEVLCISFHLSEYEIKYPFK
jgi:hypothetical protein